MNKIANFWAGKLCIYEEEYKLLGINARLTEVAAQ